MKKTNVLFYILASLVIVASLPAQDKKEKKEVKEITMTGEIVDMKCYLTGMMGGKGDDHKQCAIDCIKGGLPVGILDDKTEKVYTVVPKKGMEGANNALVQYAAQKVALTGTLVEKGGTKMFVYTKVDQAK
jgi:hypothetical protein